MTDRVAFAAGLRPPWFLGMVHLRPLPGSPRCAENLDAILQAAAADLDALVEGGADGAIIENFGDVPFYPDRVPPVTIAAMTAIVAPLCARAPDGFLLGINVLRNDAAAALAIASAVKASFIRVNVHTGAVIADQGLIIGAAHETLRLRRSLGCPVAILADVGVKHASPVGGRPVEDEARDAWERGLADCILLTGPRTGTPVDIDQLRSVRRAIPEAPLLAASGIDPERARELAPHCNGFVVGSWLKREGRISERVDIARVRQLSAARQRVRGSV